MFTYIQIINLNAEECFNSEECSPFPPKECVSSKSTIKSFLVTKYSLLGYDTQIGEHSELYKSVERKNGVY
jgi:hypothetical protein